MRLALRLLLGVAISPFILMAIIIFVVPEFISSGKWDWDILRGR